MLPIFLRGVVCWVGGVLVCRMGAVFADFDVWFDAEENALG
jgi:hypothetical protein